VRERSGRAGWWHGGAVCDNSQSARARAMPPFLFALLGQAACQVPRWMESWLVRKLRRTVAVADPWRRLQVYLLGYQIDRDRDIFKDFCGEVCRSARLRVASLGRVQCVEAGIVLVQVEVERRAFSFLSKRDFCVFSHTC
jgi:hypothetical protein